MLRRRSGPFQWKVTASYLAAALFVGSLVVPQVWDEVRRPPAMAFIAVLPPAAVTFVSYLAARRGESKRVRLFWMLFGLASLSTVIAVSASASYELTGLKQAPFPSIADIFWLGSYPLAFAGFLILLPFQSGGRRAAVEAIIDAVMLGLAAGVTTWQLAGAFESQGHSGIVASVIAAGYPTGDALLLMGLISLALLPAGSRLPVGTGWLALSLLVIVAADIGYAIREAAGSYQGGGWLDLAWPLGHTLAGLAALSAAVGRPIGWSRLRAAWTKTIQDGALLGRLPRGRLFLPYLVLPLILELLLLQFLLRGVSARTGIVTLAVTLLLVLLVLVRQSLVVIDSERTIAERSQELSRSALEKRRLILLNDLSSRLSNCETTKHVATEALDRCLDMLGCEGGGIAIAASERVRERFFCSPGLPRKERLRLLHAVRHPDDSSERTWVIPLKCGEQFLGALSLLLPQNRLYSEKADPDLVDSIAAQIAIALNNTRRYEEARYLAERDPVTTLLNQRGMFSRLEQELTRCIRTGGCFSVAMMDVDNFKQINDTYGHGMGDAVLVGISRLIATSLRGCDVVGRQGGDEFLALLVNADQTAALHLLERIRRAVKDFKITAPDGTEVTTRMSFGVATYPHEGRHLTELLALADENLYRSKQRGGDCVMSSQTDRDEADGPTTVFLKLDDLLTALDAKDHYTCTHSERVSELSVEMARMLGLPHDLQRHVRIAGLLHDVGKLEIPDGILQRPGRLTVGEFEVLKQHVVRAEHFVASISDMPDVLEAILAHHERWDGGGYPRGTRGEDTPLLGRVLAVADAYSAMTTARPYRAALTELEARRELYRVAGSQLDPYLVDVFLDMLHTSSIMEQAFALDPGAKTPPHIGLVLHSASR